MKINNSRIFKVDIRRAYNYRLNNALEFDDVCIGNTEYDTMDTGKDIICVKFAHAYVLVTDIKNIFDYLDIKSHVIGSNKLECPDDRFLFTKPSVSGNNRTEFVVNIRPLFYNEGKTSLKELHKLQEELNAENNINVGMNLMN